MTNVPLGHSGGWNVAKRGALVTLSHARDQLVSAAGLVALGPMLNHWARDPEIYAVTLDESVLRLAVADVEPGAAIAQAEFSWRLECFSKPTVSLIAGPVGEVGFALALAGTHVVAGEDFRLRCPSFERGRLPPGMLMAALSGSTAASALTRLLAGGTVGQSEAFAAGLAGLTIPAAEFPSIIDALAAADPVDPVLDERHQQPAEVSAAAQVPTNSAPANSTYVDLVVDMASALRERELDRALATVFQLDQALARLGQDAAHAALRAAASEVQIALPTRRTLQAFRKG